MSFDKTAAIADEIIVNNIQSGTLEGNTCSHKTRIVRQIIVKKTDCR